jgi:hypothetical protein
VGRRLLSRVHRIDPRRIKIHRSYTVEELARLLGCHKQSVRNWLKQGLAALSDEKRPLLIQGGVARAFLEARRRDAKRPCKLDELYCLRCRRFRTAAEETLTVDAPAGATGMLSGLCSSCGTRMFKRVSASAAVLLQSQINREAEAGTRTLKQAA